jgi:hypothetical protein
VRRKRAFATVRRLCSGGRNDRVTPRLSVAGEVR